MYEFAWFQRKRWRWFFFSNKNLSSNACKRPTAIVLSMRMRIINPCTQPALVVHLIPFMPPTIAKESRRTKKKTFAAPNGQSDNDILFYYLEMSIISISAHTASPLFCSRVSSSIGKFVNFHALVFDCECEEQSEGIQMR